MTKINIKYRRPINKLKVFVNFPLPSPALNKTKTLTRSTAAILGITALIVLTGWQLKIPALKSILSRDVVPMVANSAVCFLSCSVILILLTLGKTGHNHKIIKALSAFIMAIGVLTIIEYVADADFQIDQFLFEQPAFAGDSPGRMSVISAFNFAVIGLCFWLDVHGPDARRSIGQYAMLLVLFTTLYPFTGTIFGAVHFGSIHTTMAIPTALCFFLISIDYFIRQRETGWASLFFADDVAGVLIRRILVPLIILYPLFAFLSMQGEKAGLYNTEGATVFMMVSSLALFTFIVIITAQTVSRLDEEKDQFKKFFELSSEVLMIAGPDGSIKLVSSAFTKVLGYSRQEGVNNSFFMFVHADDFSLATRHFEEMRKNQVPGSFQIMMKGKNEKIRHFLWSHTADLKSGNIYAAGYDITEIKEAQQVRELAERLTRQNQQLASFAHIVSHNLRSHVGNLNSLLHLHKLAEAGEQGVLFGMFEKVSQHLSGTLNDLIESLRIKEDMNQERHQIYFHQVLSKTEEILSSQVMESQAEISHDFRVESIAYPATYLESIFLNLISNAIKYRSEARRLHVRLETFQLNSGVVLTIQDNGQGINMTRHGDKLFGFYKTFHEGKDSKGIGLFITKTQIEAMGGTITAESEVDKGTIFTIVFAAADEERYASLQS